MTAFDDEAFKRVVLTVFALQQGEYRDDLAFGGVPSWDSLNHFQLIFSLEDAFKVRFHSEEIAQLKSLSEIKRALVELVSGPK